MSTIAQTTQTTETSEPQECVCEAVLYDGSPWYIAGATPTRCGMPARRCRVRGGLAEVEQNLCMECEEFVRDPEVGHGFEVTVL